MIIGIDLDNTLIDYDHSFVAAAGSLGHVFPETVVTKHSIREHLRANEGGEAVWQKLQGLVYGRFVVSHAKLYPGVKRFLWRCAIRNVLVKVVSHKTEFGHFDAEKVSLRQAALQFLLSKKVTDPAKPLISEVTFEATRQEKVKTILAKEFDWFIDDLPEVIADLGYQQKLKKILFDPTGSQVAFPDGQVTIASDWQQIDTIINGEWMIWEVEQLACELLGENAIVIEKISTGGNAGVFKLQTESKGTVKLKIYPVDARHDRLHSEYLALRGITGSGVHSVSMPVAKDDEIGIGIYEWIDGSRLTEHTQADLQQALDFLKQLHAMRNIAQFAEAPNASASCFRGTDIERQIYGRLAQFDEVRSEYGSLDAFLEDEFLPVARHLLAEAHSRWPGEHGMKTVLSRDQQTLSPSDFGFHNMIRKADDTLSFFDFEYFGWDDPVKLVSDFSFHPGMNLTAEDITFWIKGAEEIYGDDIRERLAVSRPLYGLIWCLILLNDFRPEIWQRRIMADKSKVFSRTETLARQLQKARALLSDIQQTTSLII